MIATTVPGELLAPSAWTVVQARSLLAEARPLARTASEYDGLELFGSLCGYLDELQPERFERLLTGTDRVRLAEQIAGVRNRPASHRPDQPVNCALSLTEGRGLAAAMSNLAGGWQAELGRALIGLYGYLDDLYGGPGRFAELLTRDERNLVCMPR